MKIVHVLTSIGLLAAVSASPVFAGDGGQAVKQAVADAKAAGETWGS